MFRPLYVRARLSLALSLRNKVLQTSRQTLRRLAVAFGTSPDLKGNKDERIDQYATGIGQEHRSGDAAPVELLRSRTDCASSSHARLIRLLGAMVLLPLAISILSFVTDLAIGGPITVDPLRIFGGALTRLAAPGTRADSWDPMLHALSFARNTGSGLYNTIFFQQHEKFQYPPTSLLWLQSMQYFWPVNQITLNRVNALAFAVNGFGCVLLLKNLTACSPDRAMAGTVPPSQLGHSMVWSLILAFALPYTFWPTLYGLYMGQIQIWIDLLFTSALLLWFYGHRGASGILVALACTIKPQLGLTLIWAIFWRERDFALGLAATLLLLGTISVVSYGLGNHIEYLDVLAFISRHGEYFHANQSVNGLMNRLLFLGNNTDWRQDQFAPYNIVVYVFTLLTSLAFIIIPMWMATRARAQRAGPFDLCIAALCFTMASPIAWEHHYGITLPIYLAVFVRVLAGPFRARRGTLLACLWISWVLVGSNLQIFDGFADTGLNFLQSHVLFGALLLLFVLLTLASDLRPERTGWTARRPQFARTAAKYGQPCMRIDTPLEISGLS